MPETPSLVISYPREQCRRGSLRPTELFDRFYEGIEASGDDHVWHRRVPHKQTSAQAEGLAGSQS